MKKQIVATIDEDLLKELDSFARSAVRSRSWAITYLIAKGLSYGGNEETDKNPVE